MKTLMKIFGVMVVVVLIFPLLINRATISGLGLLVIICMIGCYGLKKYLAFLKVQRKNKEKRIYGIMHTAYSNKDINRLNELSEDERRSPYYQSAFQKLSERTLYDNLLVFASHEKTLDPINFNRLFQVLIFWSSVPELGECYQKYVKSAKAISLSTNGLFGDVSDALQMKKRIQEIAVDYKTVLPCKENLPFVKEVESELSGIAFHVIMIEKLDCEVDYSEVHSWLDIVTGNRYNKTMISLIPAKLISLAQMDERTEEIVEYEKHLYKLYEYYYQVWCRKNNTEEYHPLLSADYLIMKSLIYMRGNLMESINEELKKYLYPDDDLLYDRKEYEKGYLILQKFYEAYSLVNQEKMVLTAMIERKMAISSELEQRLVYLNSGVKNDFSIYHNSKDETSDEIIYDYRSLNWTASDLKNYFDTLIAKRTSVNTDLVVDAWEKRLSVTNGNWDICIAQKRIQELMQKEFGDCYVCEIKRAGSITESGVDLEPALYIHETCGNEKYLSYLINVQKLTNTSMFISIYILYTAFSKETSENYMQDNMDNYNRVISIKERQNPKINNKIDIVKQILIEELERIINSSMDNNIYY